MFCPPVLYYFFILEEDWTPTFIGGEMRQISLGGSPISFQDKASGGLLKVRAPRSKYAEAYLNLSLNLPHIYLLGYIILVTNYMDTPTKSRVYDIL